MNVYFAVHTLYNYNVIQLKAFKYQISQFLPFFFAMNVVVGV